MPQRRKLQVFVSSTFTDLKDERQIAVESILTTGHIPAGMELFAGKNEEQMNIIKQWIDESDIYMLLLGGRYGTVEEFSGKSYTHLEYDYAKSIGKTIFVVVASEEYINQKAKDKGHEGVVELDHRTEYLKFKKEITGKYVKFWNSYDTLKLAIITTLHVLDRDENLIGWVLGSEATNSGAIAEEMARLVKENSELRKQLNHTPKENITYNSLLFSEMYRLLSSEEINLDRFSAFYRRLFELTAQEFGDEFVSILHIFIVWTIYSSDGVYDTKQESYLEYIIEQLKDAGLVINYDKDPLGISDEADSSTEGMYIRTEIGKKYILKMKIERNVNKVKQFVVELQEVTGENSFYPFKI